MFTFGSGFSLLKLPNLNSAIQHSLLEMHTVDAQLTLAQISISAKSHTTRPIYNV